jgi:hypothetical protein
MEGEMTMATAQHNAQAKLDDFDHKLGEVHLGDHVRDVTGDGSTMVVVGLSASRADEYPALINTTVHDLNPEFPADDYVVEVVYPGHGLSLDTDDTYPFPRSRLRVARSAQD